MDNTNSKFQITPKAKQDLKLIWKYTLKVWGENQASKYISDLYDCFEWLANMPKSGKHRPEIKEGYYCFPHKKHIIFYILIEETIAIIGLPHETMDIEEFFAS
jgi:toxin ParE1/3/4